MKKIILLVAALLAVALLVACGTEKTENPDETGNENIAETSGETGDDNPNKNPDGFLPVDPADFYKFEQFTLPEGDFRDAAVEHMYKQASIEWVCSEDFSVKEEWNHWGINLDFKKGTVYHGIPYADTKVSYDDFMNNLKDGTFTADSSAWKDVLGVQCVSSFMNAIQQFNPDVAGTSTVMMPGSSSFEAKIVGDYKVPEKVKRTVDIIEANGSDKIYECYGLLKKGDIIGSRDATKSTSHYRMLVEDAVVYKNGAGKFVPSRSSVKTIEQTNAFDRERPGINSTWFVDHVYSFEELLNSKYIPLTFDIYSKDRSECEIPYLALDKEITPEILGKGSFSASIKSNFPIRFVYMDVLDRSGATVKHVVIRDMEDSRAVPLRNHAFKLFATLESGDYTFVLTAGIARGSAEFARIDFSYTAK